MRDRRNATVIILATMLAGVLSAPAAHGVVLLRVGYAYDLKTEKLLYSENHREIYDNGKIVESTVTYRRDDGVAFAQKILDFRQNRLMPDFRLENQQIGHIEGARRIGERCEVFFQRKADEEAKRRLLEFPDRGVMDAGFDRFIEDNWERLVEGETFIMPFLVPSYQDFIDFRIRKIADKGDRNGNKMYVFRMDVKSALLRLFADPIEVTYNNDRILHSYNGISNIKDRDGENLNVRVDFPITERQLLPGK